MGVPVNTKTGFYQPGGDWRRPSAPVTRSAGRVARLIGRNLSGSQHSLSVAGQRLAGGDGKLRTVLTRKEK